MKFWGPVSGLGLAVTLVTMAIDQAHKWWMILGYGIQLHEKVEVLPFLNFYYVLNKGVSYGLLGNVGQFGLTAFALVVFVVMFWWLAQNSSKLIAWGLGLIMGGALGNAIDRVTLGGVADFFQLHAYGYSWYIFNIADIAIVAGVAVLLYDLLIVSRKSASNSS